MSGRTSSRHMSGHRAIQQQRTRDTFLTTQTARIMPVRSIMPVISILSIMSAVSIILAVNDFRQCSIIQ